MPYKDKNQQREYQREWLQKRRDAFFQDKNCKKCNCTTDLQLDHIDPGVKVSHRIWSWSEERRQQELIKCQILCKDCHWEKTIQYIRELSIAQYAPCGTNSAYRRGCRCDPCHTALLEYWRARRKDTPEP